MHTTIIKYSLLTALRDLLYIGICVAISIAIGISIFLGKTALAEQNQMIITYIAGSGRIIISNGLVLFICFHIKRMLDNKEIDLLLSRPISRSTFILSYWTSVVIITLFIIIPLALIISIFKETNIAGLIYWSCSIFYEVIIMSAFALLTTVIFNNAVVSILSCYGVYIISRMIGFFIALDDGNLMQLNNTILNNIMKLIINVASAIMPRLDFFGKSEWLIYGIESSNEIMRFQVQTLCYIPLLLAVSIFDIQKKEL